MFPVFMSADIYAMIYLADELYPGRPITDSGSDLIDWLAQVTGQRIPDAPAKDFLCAVVPILIKEADRQELTVSPTLRRYAKAD